MILLPAITAILETGLDLYSGSHPDDRALAHGVAMIAKRKPHQYANITAGDVAYWYGSTKPLRCLPLISSYITRRNLQY